RPFGSIRGANLGAGFMPGGQTIFVCQDGGLSVFDLGGGQIRQIPTPEEKVSEAHLAADGAHIVFVYDPLAAVAPGVYFIGLDGRGRKKVVHTNVAGREETSPDWGP